LAETAVASSAVAVPSRTFQLAREDILLLARRKRRRKIQQREDESNQGKLKGRKNEKQTLTIIGW
jgi:hypothetical protein